MIIVVCLFFSHVLILLKSIVLSHTNQFEDQKEVYTASLLIARQKKLKRSSFAADSNHTIICNLLIVLNKTVINEKFIFQLTGMKNR